MISMDYYIEDIFIPALIVHAIIFALLAVVGLVFIVAVWWSR